MLDKQSVLAGAPNALNRQDIPFQVTVEGNAIVARWKWMDARFFAPHEVTDEARSYTFTATLYDNGTWQENDQIQNKSSGIGFSKGSLKLGTSSQSFKGKTSQKSFQFGLGQNKETGQTGLVGFKFDTSLVKQHIRSYLTYYGWRQV